MVKYKARRSRTMVSCLQPTSLSAVQSLEDEAPTKPINVIGIEITKDIPDLVKANNLAPHPMALIKARTDGTRPKDKKMQVIVQKERNGTEKPLVELATYK